MYIQVVLNSLYVGNVFHVYLNALLNGKKMDWAIITHEEYVKSPLKYVPLFFEVFEESDVVTEEERARVPQLGIKEEFYDRKEQELGSRTNTIMDLISKRDFAFEECVENFLNKLENTSIEIEGFIIFGEGYESIRYLAQQHNYVVINWELSTFRKVYDFPINLMFGNLGGQLYGTNEGIQRYQNFKKECQNISFFSRRELIALFGRYSTMQLLPLLNYDKYKYEMGICGGNLFPPVFCRVQYIDDDILHKLSKIYKENEVIIREHPAYSRNFMFERRYPTQFILSCKRIAAVASNTLFEAMLWNRVACTECELISFSFACEKDFQSENKVEEAFLNFYTIAYLIPKQKYLFNPEYWEWRRGNTSEKNIYLKHLDIILTELGLDSSILKLDEKSRFIKILEARGFAPYEIEAFSQDVSRKELDFNVLSSVLECKDDNREIEKCLYCLNEIEDNEVVSKFTIEGDYSELNFYPYYDISGIIKINQIIVNDDVLTDNEENFSLIELYWKKKIECHLKNAINTIVIRWEYQEFNLPNIKSDLQYYKEKLQYYEEKAEKYHHELEQVYNSKSWKITKPIRIAGDLIKKS